MPWWCSSLVVCAWALAGAWPSSAHAQETRWLIQATNFAGPLVPTSYIRLDDDPKSPSRGQYYTTTGATRTNEMALRFQIPVAAGLSMRFDLGLVNAVSAGGVARILAQYQGKWVAGGIGLGGLTSMREAEFPHDGVIVPLWLRIGPDVVHLRARLWEGGVLADPLDVGAVGLEAQVNLDPSILALGISGVRTTQGNGVEVVASTLLPPVRVALGATFYPHADAAQVGIAIAFAAKSEHLANAFGAEPLQTRAPPPAPVQRSVRWDAERILRPGTTFALAYGPLRVRSDTPIPQGELTTCVVDEQVAAAGLVWSHVTCQRDLPAEAPLTWRSGCYVSNQDGIWRLPACPGQERLRNTSAELIVPVDAGRARSGFIDLSDSREEARVLVVDGAPQTATCLVRELDGEIEQCFGKFGLYWSAWRWRGRVDARAERAVRLLSVRSGGAFDGNAPHLQFARPDSARCEIAPDCTFFGQCRASDDGCLAASDADCRNAAVCSRWGRCTAAAGLCQASTDVDCAASEGCTQRGLCSLGAGRCVAKEKDCAISIGCRASGSCTVVDGRCLVRSDADCAASEGCVDEGRCRAQEGECRVRDDADCKAAACCTGDKRCKALDGRCVAELPRNP